MTSARKIGHLRLVPPHVALPHWAIAIVASSVGVTVLWLIAIVLLVRVVSTH